MINMWLRSNRMSEVFANAGKWTYNSLHKMWIMTNNNRYHLLNTHHVLLHALLPDFLLSSPPLPFPPNLFSSCFNKYWVPTMFQELFMVKDTMALKIQIEFYSENHSVGKVGYSSSLKKNMLCQNGLKCLPESLLVDKGWIGE